MLTTNELLLRDTLTAKGKRATPTPPINYLRLSYDNFTALDDIDASLEGHANRATANCIDLAHLATIESKNGNDSRAIGNDHQLALVAVETIKFRFSYLLDGRRRIASHIDKSWAGFIR